MKKPSIEKQLIGLLFLFVMAVYSLAEKDSKKLDLLNSQLNPKSSSETISVSNNAIISPAPLIVSNPVGQMLTTDLPLEASR